MGKLNAQKRLYRARATRRAGDDMDPLKRLTRAELIRIISKLETQTPINVRGTGIDGKAASSPHISQVSRCGEWVRAGGWFRTWPARVPAAVGGWAGSTMVSLVAGLVESRSQAAAALRNRA